MKIIKAQHLEDGRQLHWKVPEHLENVKISPGDFALVNTLKGEQIVKITAVFFSETEEVKFKNSGYKFTITQSVIDFKVAPKK